MSKVTRKIALWALSLLFVLCVSILGIHISFSANAEDTPVEVTFTNINSSWNDNSETLGNGMHYTVLHLDGLLTSGYLGQGDDWSGMNATINGGASYFSFSPASYIAGPNVECNYIIIYSATAPTTGDVFTVTAGSTFKVGGDDTNVYELASDISLKFNGTAWEYYVPVVDNTQFVTEFTNNGQFVVGNYNSDAVNYPYKIIDGSTASLPTGYTGAVAKIGSKINGGAAYINIDFTASQISAADVESVVARVYSPDYTADDQLRINNVGGYIASADLSNWCNVVIPVANITGNDGNLGSFAFGLRDKGTVSDYFYIDSITVNMVQPPEVVSATFTHINSDWNNNSATLGNGMYYTVLHIGGLTSSGYYTQGDDWTDMTAKATINGEASYFSFCPASFIAGPNVSADFIVMYSATAPTVGDELFVPAGTTFKVGGDDTNVYELVNDISLKFNGTAWEVYDPNAQPPVDPEPEVPPVDPEPTEPVLVTFTHVNSTFNNNTEVVAGMYYTVIHLDGVLTSGYFTQGDDFTDMAANVTGVTYFGFAPASIIAGPDKTEINWIILYSATAPTEGDVFTVTAGATFKVGGADTNVYKLANDISLKFNGTAWEVYDPNAQPPVDPEPEVPPVDPEPTEPVLVTFTQINSAWNNNVETLNNGRYYTVLHLDGLLTSGYLGQGDDWSGMNATINGGTSYFNFSPASYIAGPNLECNYIILYSATAPTEEDVFTVTAGSTFKVGGDDTNVYELVNDISLKFNGTAWEVYDPNEQPPVDPPVIEPTEKASVTLTGANGVWNNFDYTDQGYFCTFLHFEGGIGGGGLDGDFSNLLSNVTLNGQPLDTENVSFVCARWIGWENGIILRFKTLPQENSILVFPAGTTFTVGGEDANVYEISETMELKMKNGKWNIPLPTAEFIGVNAWNNNIVTLAGSRLTILDFDVTAMGNAVNTDKNLIAMAGVSINGVKLTDIDGASITYMHGDNHMGIDIPASAIYPTQEYPITILKVAAGTVFENYELPEITLSLIGGTWVVGEFETMPEEDEYVTISDITGEERVELGSEGLMSAMDGFAGDVNFKFVYRSDEAIMNYAPYGGLAVYLNSTNSWDGWRIFFVGNVVYVYDATMGGVGDEHVLLGQAEFGIASSFEMQIEISVKQVGGKYSIVIGGSCAKILELNDITPIGDCIGGGISLYSATRSCSVKDYKYGDVFDPVLTINSKQEIVINEGEAVPEIDATAVDGLTEITPTYVWDEGAITDGKMNVGVWNCVVTATDANGNYATATVRVTVKGEAKYMVTFDGANEGEYAYGEKIVKPADPTKEATEKYQYTFDGWYNGDEKWDFDHDIVTSDVALVAKFIESDVYYKVAVTVSSETQTIYVTYGAQVDLSVFDKEGFEKEVKQNGEVITKLIVTEDTAIEITYTQSASNTPSGCAGGCAGSLTGVGGIGVLLTLIGGGMLMRKKEETDEK